MLALLLLLTIAALPIHFITRTFFRRLNLVDKPDNLKKLHKDEVPLSGGFSFVFSLIFISVFTYFLISMNLINFSSDFFSFNETLSKLIIWLVISSFLLIIVSFFDDIIGLPILVRLIFQVSICVIFIFFTDIKIDSLGNLLGFGQINFNTFFSYFFTTFCVVGMINAYNWIDGIDGLFSSMVFITLMSIYFFLPNLNLIFILIISSLLPYSLMNLGLFGEKFKVFMGDHGAMMIGFVIAFSLIGFSKTELIRPIDSLWLVNLVLLNALGTQFARAFNKKSIFNSDRNHIHHYFLKEGFSEKNTLLILTLLGICLSTLGILLNFYQIEEYVSFYIFFLIIILCCSHAVYSFKQENL